MNDIIAIIIFISSIGLGIIYWLVSARNGVDKATHESNEILRGLINDQKQELINLRDRMHIVENKLTVVTIKGEFLEKIINVALIEYFAQYPETAKSAKDALEAYKKKEDKKIGG